MAMLLVSHDLRVMSRARMTSWCSTPAGSANAVRPAGARSPRHPYTRRWPRVCQRSGRSPLCRAAARCSGQPAGSAVRLPVPSTLCAGPGPVRHRGSGRPRGRAGPVVGLPLRRGVGPVTSATPALLDVDGLQVTRFGRPRRPWRPRGPPHRRGGRRQSSRRASGNRCLVGESGSGKTTLARCVGGSGLRRPGRSPSTAPRSDTPVRGGATFDPDGVPGSSLVAEPAE